MFSPHSLSSAGTPNRSSIKISLMRSRQGSKSPTASSEGVGVGGVAGVEEEEGAGVDMERRR